MSKKWLPKFYYEFNTPGNGVFVEAKGDSLTLYRGNPGSDGFREYYVRMRFEKFAG